MKNPSRIATFSTLMVLALVTGQAAGLKCYECTGGSTAYECGTQAENTCDANLNEDRCMVALKDTKYFRHCINNAACAGYKGLSEVTNILNNIANAFGQSNVITSGYRCCDTDLCNEKLSGHAHTASVALLAVCAVVGALMMRN